MASAALAWTTVEAAAAAALAWTTVEAAAAAALAWTTVEAAVAALAWATAEAAAPPCVGHSGGGGLPLRGPQRRRLVPPVLRQPPEAQEPRTQSVPGVAYVLRRVMAATQQRPFHSVVFSVSGFPGEFVTEEVAREQVSPKRSTLLPWAVAGSCREKLQRVLERSALKLGKGGARVGGGSSANWGAPAASATLSPEPPSQGEGSSPVK